MQSPDTNVPKYPTETEKLGKVDQALQEILTDEQQAVLRIEQSIAKISLSTDAKIIAPNSIIESSSQVNEWLAKDHVLDAACINGTILVLFNTHVGIPEELRNVFEMGRAGEYDPTTNIAYTDISNTYSHLEEQYQPQWVEHNARHELRHALVAQQDAKLSTQQGAPMRRLLDDDYLRNTDPDGLRQLSYLDELHAQFLDVVEGDIQGHTSFRSLESEFYSTEASGAHIDVSSTNPEVQAHTRDLFHLLQGFILLTRMVEDQADLRSDDSEKLSYAAGAVLATERGVEQAVQKIEQIWNIVRNDKEMYGQLIDFIDKYQPSNYDNTPVLDDNLKDYLLGNGLR